MLVVSVPRDESKPYMRLVNAMVSKQVDPTAHQDKRFLVGISDPRDGSIELKRLVPRDAA